MKLGLKTKMLCLQLTALLFIDFLRGSGVKSKYCELLNSKRYTIKCLFIIFSKIKVEIMECNNSVLIIGTNRSVLGRH